jgi:multiple sugar transport system substrate-binding protein
MRKAASILAVLVLAAGSGFATPQSEAAAGPQTVRFWYHFDKPEVSITPLVEKFQKENPTIKVVPEFIDWNSYYQKLVTAISGGTPPDVSQIKLWWQPQLVEMGALAPVDDYLGGWPAKSDVFENVWSLTRHSDGKQYLMPLQMVILYMYYRVDMMRDLGLKPAATRDEFLEAAKKLTRDTNGDGSMDVYGFGIRGGRGGHDWWGTFVLSSGAQFFDAAGKPGLTTPEAIAANQWFIDMYRVHKVSPPTTPTDGFAQIIANMKSGRTATTIHHLGSAADLEGTLGDKLSAFPVPRGTRGAWTSFGDEENGLLAASRAKNAGFKWMAFLATAENNALWQKSSGQVSINISNGQTREAMGNRFLKATTDSAPFAGVMPAHPRVAEFVESVWPAQMQRAFNGEITSAQMMQAFADHFAGK